MNEEGFTGQSTEEPPELDASGFACMMMQITRGNQGRMQAHYRWIRYIRRATNMLAKGYLEMCQGKPGLARFHQLELHTLALLTADLHYTKLYQRLRKVLWEVGVFHIPERLWHARMDNKAQREYVTAISTEYQAQLFQPKPGMTVPPLVMTLPQPWSKRAN